jgi:hypothetical protein
MPCRCDQGLTACRPSTSTPPPTSSSHDDGAKPCRGLVGHVLGAGSPPITISRVVVVMVPPVGAWCSCQVSGPRTRRAAVENAAMPIRGVLRRGAGQRAGARSAAASCRARRCARRWRVACTARGAWAAIRRRARARGRAAPSGTTSCTMPIQAWPRRTSPVGSSVSRCPSRRPGEADRRAAEGRCRGPPIWPNRVDSAATVMSPKPPRR